jgi:DNA polymerase-3 subunit beta
MKFTATREQILQPLQGVIGVVERKQTMPILANVLIAASSAGRLAMTGTDLEVELVASGDANVVQAGEITVPGRKFLEIIRALPDKTTVTIAVDGDKVKVSGGRSRFVLSSLPAAEFPVVEEISAQQALVVPQAELKRLIEKTHFSMAQQDVRYYLNGTLLEAAADLGCRPTRTFFSITLPLTKEGIVAGCMLVFIPATGEFVIPALLGGPDSLMIGRVLWEEFFNNRDWPVASAVAILLLLLLVGPIMLYQRAQQAAGGAHR